MEINNIMSSMGPASGPSGASDNNELGQDNFLQLLVAQMQNQDPINPMDGKDLASQLAQFNSVEQLISVNSGLETLQKEQEMMRTSMTNSLATSLAGKEVRALSDQIHLESGADATVQYELNTSADRVEVIIRSENGSEVRRETLEGAATGDNRWNWDGLNNAGIRMADGNYSVEIQAFSGEDRVSSLTFVEGIAHKIRYSENGVMLSVNNIELPIGNVEEVGAAPGENEGR